MSNLPNARIAATAALAALAAALWLDPLAAQVGHDPARSPYRDLRYGQFLSATAGYLFGGGGQFGVGPHRGPVATLRHDFLAERTLSVALVGVYARLERNIADPFVATEPRIRGPIEHRVLAGEGVLQLNLAGGKTWHGLAPYVSAAAGLAFAEGVPEDTSGYKFGTKIYFAPALGVRAFLSRRLFLRLEARTLFWNLSYPEARFENDPDGAFGPLVPLLANRPRKEWVPSPMLHAGLGYAFRRPFF